MTTFPRTYKVGNMDCAHCALEVETGVRKLDGVQDVRVDFASGQMILNGDVPYDTLRQRVEALGKTLENPAQPAADSLPKRGGVLGFVDYLLARRETQLALIGGAGIVLTLLASLLFPIDGRVIGAAYTVFMLITVYPIARSGLNTLRINHEFGINLLMTIAAVGAIVIGEYLESATVIFLFAVGEALEGYTADRARHSLRSLLELTPPRAIRLHNGHEETVPVEALHIDDTILVKPGERIPMDGEVLTGTSSANQAPITG
ncbi:MAG: cation transporter, partial [Anaerolineae bacterium]|nr:cation transporter [Anaerolineae bacterium]